MKLPKKLILALILLFSTLVFAKTILAAEEGSGWYVQPPETWQRKVSQPPTTEVFGERYWLWGASNWANIIIAAVGGTTKIAQGPNGPVYTQEGGAANIMASVVTRMTTGPPISSVEYLADVGQNLGIVKPVYAQGIGFGAFSSILPIWKVFRDIAYLGFVIIFVIVGFMIMFRKKIDPRTVVTVQEALPRIVIALLLITFSYAIAGLIVDLGDLISRLIGVTLARNQLIATGAGPYSQRLETLLQANVFELINPLRNFDRLVQHVGEIGAPPTDIPVLAQLTVAVIFWLAGLFIMFKIFFALIGPYIAIIISVIFAPFQLLMTALPGGENAPGNWLKNLVANVAVFPAVFAMLAIAAVIKGYTKPAVLGPSAEWGLAGGNYQILWSPAAIGNWGVVAQDLISFGILFTIPKVVEIVQGALGIKPAPWMGAAAAEVRGKAAAVPIFGRFFRE